MVARGDVWWCESPEGGRRPYLILTRNEALPVLNQVLAVPATSTIRGIPTEVGLDRSDGMPQACVLNVDSMALVRPAHCTELITRLGPAKMLLVCEALRRAIAC